MPSSFSDFLEDALLDHVFGGGNYTRAATVYVALFTASPSDSGGGTEVTGGSYARVTVTNNATNWPASAGGSKSNGTPITFPMATADWGIAVAVGIFDDLAAGNLLSWSTLADPKTIDLGDTASFNAGDITITLD